MNELIPRALLANAPEQFTEDQLTPRFALNQRVTHRFFGSGTIRGYRYHNGDELWAVQFEKFSARIPTHALQAAPALEESSCSKIN